MLLTDLIELTLREMKARGDFHNEVYTPFYPTSYALHAFNLMNQEKKIYYEGKQVPNKRLHLVFVGPPMSSKSYYLEQMSHSENAIFNDTGHIMAAKSNLTEAGLCGTFTMQNGSMVKQMGEAERHKHDFLLTDEFSAISAAFKQIYNAGLEAQLLAALDHGKVYKSLGPGPISFKTSCTIWAGVQPHKLRMDKDSGLGRRLCFMVNIPDAQQLTNLQRAMFFSQNIQPETNEIEELHNEIKMWNTQIQDLKHISYDESILDYFIDNKVNPLQQPLAQNIILGYHLARERWDSDGYLHMTLKDQMLLDMLANSRKWFEEVRAGPDLMQLKLLAISYGKHTDIAGGYIIKKVDLIKHARSLSMTIKDANEKLAELIKYGIATIDTSGSVVTIVDDY